MNLQVQLRFASPTTCQSQNPALYNACPEAHDVDFDDSIRHASGWNAQEWNCQTRKSPYFPQKYARAQEYDIRSYVGGFFYADIPPQVVTADCIA